MTYISDQEFHNIDYRKVPLERGDYEGCLFSHCNLTELYLNGFRFIDCEFTNCDLSSAKLRDSSWQDTRFKGCKMLGLLFEQSDRFGLRLDFDHCILEHSSFFELDMAKTRFENCKLTGVDFTRTNLSEAIFNNCDLLDAVFDHTNLKGCDLRTADHYRIDPEQNKMNGARVSIPGLNGILGKYGISIE
ncbi:pentapeptide repeat-containing protein [Robertkochia solimangrovi]|uniref:pentapeptide repeat-containing protein n=1 Tax=Robertkochia solimangrovi TaxID=2213046 RepID=UPI00117C3DAA|nr:pentapeptide repeat-containing protein [Robertkochia solimangrovi]TRZ44317.1 pentapeptide repeat-containing protein [Robertkochia solimangrovi]